MRGHGCKDLRVSECSTELRGWGQAVLLQSPPTDPNPRSAGPGAALRWFWLINELPERLGEGQRSPCPPPPSPLWRLLLLLCFRPGRRTACKAPGFGGVGMWLQERCEDGQQLRPALPWSSAGTAAPRLILSPPSPIPSPEQLHQDLQIQHRHLPACQPLRAVPGSGQHLFPFPPHSAGELWGAGGGGAASCLRVSSTLWGRPSPPNPPLPSAADPADLLTLMVHHHRAFGSRLDHHGCQRCHRRLRECSPQRCQLWAGGGRGTPAPLMADPTTPSPVPSSAIRATTR